MVTSKSEMVTNYWSFGKKYLVWKRTGWFFAFKKALKVVIDWGHLRSIETIFFVVGTPWSHLGHKIWITLRIFFIESNNKGRMVFKKYNKINKKKAPIFRWGLFRILERERRLELPTPTLARLCSTNWAIPAMRAIIESFTAVSTLYNTFKNRLIN